MVVKLKLFNISRDKVVYREMANVLSGLWRIGTWLLNVEENRNLQQQWHDRCFLLPLVLAKIRLWTIFCKTFCIIVNKSCFGKKKKGKNKTKD